MTRVNVTLGVRSVSPKEVRPGIMAYDFTTYDNIPGLIVNSGFSIEDHQTSNQNWTPNTQISFIMSNDSRDRLNRISFLIYLGIKYKVTGVAIARPRVTLTLGGTWNDNDSSYVV